eukprot:m.129306 g.129306  ORF g.129306 m.129306 type:complete len:51 (+) comp17458_c0_seq6:769-921(+)
MTLEDLSLPCQQNFNFPTTTLVKLSALSTAFANGRLCPWSSISTNFCSLP